MYSGFSLLQNASGICCGWLQTASLALRQDGSIRSDISQNQQRLRGQFMIKRSNILSINPWSVVKLAYTQGIVGNVKNKPFYIYKLSNTNR